MAPRKKVDKPFCSGTMTKSAMMSFIRSGLRQKSRRWAPIYQCLARAKRPSQSKNKKLKNEFLCSMCGGWFAQADVQVDHIRAVGSLKELEDLPAFVRNLFCEVDGLRVVCTDCHQIVTNEQAALKRNKSE